MASESSFTDQSIHELGEKKIGDHTNEEERHEPKDVTVGDKTKMEEEHVQVGEIKNYLQESQATNSSEPAIETNEGKSNDVVEIFTSKEPVNSEVKQEDLKDAEVAVTSENESKSEEAPLISTEVVLDTSEQLEDNASIPDSIKVPVKDLEVEPNSSDEQKQEESAETKADTELIKSEDAKDEVQELIPANIPSDASEAPEKDDVGSIIPISTEVPVKDTKFDFLPPEEKKGEDAEENNVVDSIILTNIEVPVKEPDVDLGSPEEQKQEEGAGIKEHIESNGSENSNEEVQELVPAKGSINASEAPEKSDSDSSTLATIEVPVKDLEVESGYPEEQKQAEGAEIKEHLEFIGSENTNDEVQESGPSKVSINASESPEKSDVDSSTLTTVEGPVKDLEVESGCPEEQKQEEGVIIKENIKLMEPEDSKEEVQELVPAKVSINASETAERSYVDSSTLATIEEPVKDLEVESGYPEEQKSAESAETEVENELVKSEDSKDDQVFVPAEISTITSEALEKKDVDSSSTSTGVTMKDLEVESGSPEEQKLEEIVETKQPSSNASSIEGGGEVAAPSSYEEKSSGVEVVEKKDNGIKDEVIQTNTVLPEDLKARSEEDQTRFHENKISREGAVEEGRIVEGGLGTSIVLDVVPPVSKSSSEYENVSDPDLVVPGKKDDGIDTVSEVSEVLLEGNVIKEHNFIDEEKDVNVDDINRGLVETSIDPITAKVSTEQVEAHENMEEPLKVTSKELNGSPESNEVPPVGERISAGDEKNENIKGEGSTLEFESGSTEWQKPEESAEIKEPSSNMTTIDDGEVVGSSPYEEKPSGVAEVVENKDEGIKEEVMQTTAELPDDLEDRSEVDKTRPNEDKVSREGAAEEDRIVEGGLETSTIFDVVPSVAKFSFEDEKVSDLGEVVQKRKDDGVDNVPEVSEVPLKENILEEDNSVDKEKDANAETIERGLAETSIDRIVAKAFTEQVQAPENMEGSPKERVPAGDEKSESLKGEGSTLVETPKDITISDESHDQLIDEKKNESSKIETDASVFSSDAVKDIIASETYKEEKDETLKDLSLKEKNVNVEAKVEETIESVTDKPEHEELEAEKEESEKPNDQDTIVSSDIQDAKTIKEVTKRESNIFTKVKRSFIKAKKAILKKSSGPTTVSTEAKDEHV